MTSHFPLIIFSEYFSLFLLTSQNRFNFEASIINRILSKKMALSPFGPRPRAAEYALASPGHHVSSSEEPLLSAPTFLDGQDDEVHEDNHSDDGVKCSTPEILFAHRSWQSLQSQSSLNLASNRRPFYRASPEQTNPHNTPASSSDCLSFFESTPDQDARHGRAQSTSTSRRASGWLRNDSSPGQIVGSHPILRSKSSPSGAGLDCSDRKGSNVYRLQVADADEADETACVDDDFASPGNSLFGSPPRIIAPPHVRFAGQESADETDHAGVDSSFSETLPTGSTLRGTGPLHVRFAGHSARRQSPYYLANRRRKSPWRPVSLHRRHPRRISYRSPARIRKTSTGDLERSSSTGTLSMARPPSRAFYHRMDSTDTGPPSSQVSNVCSSPVSKCDERSVPTATSTPNDKEKSAAIAVSLDKSNYSIWSSSAGPSSYSIHMRINWSIIPSANKDGEAHNTVPIVARMDSAANLARVNLIVPVRLLWIIAGVSAVARGFLSTRIASAIVRTMAVIATYLTALLLWIVSRLRLNFGVLQVQIELGE